FYSMALEKGDYVVHSDYGIGKFIGLETIETDGKLTECLLIEYADKEKLYVPVDDFHKVSKYLGGKTDVKLASLKKLTFKKVKEQARERIREYAGQLLELYALRKGMRGFSFKENSGLIEEFIEAFPYEETEDQAKTWQEIKRDMEAHVPMDRLVTGEVGFGKTEMAMRAAFLAVLCKKQVAVLAPTTVLANQHYKNFTERFKYFPVTIELISRVRSAGEQKKLIERLAKGEIDIIIGTHRLLSDDVKFQDLGLLIIDEEQKFGVEQKEKIKMWQKGVDVLTLTATPIPRTLYMSLGGVRDMSIINSPPEGRKPIYTEIVEFKPDIIVEAIKRELERDGQVYFLHNRVESINQMKNFLQNLMPDVSFAVAHGRMKPAELGNVMQRFIEKEFDVLVTTTIIEAGTDIPNVNTLIVNRADKFGLAQLYQLRGRIGRSDRQAYAYFLIPPYKTLPKNVRAR
ncbi:MAG: DEAD/DEAH box helicase, partial [bacterium]